MQRIITDTSLNQTATRIESYLESAAFPAAKDELVAHASMRGAPEDLLAVLDALPQHDYGSMAAVMDAVKTLTPEADDF